jgi:hypothetical protein
MNLTVQDNGFQKHGAVLKERIAERIPVSDGGMVLELTVDAAIRTPESYRIDQTDKGYRIAGSDTLGLYFGIGKFLHTAKWTETELIPAPPVGVSSPACSLRGMYFAMHLKNWYANAETEELDRYIEDLLLWGYNGIFMIVPVIDLFSFEDELCRTSVQKSHALFKMAKARGMRVGLFICPNQGLRSAPHEWDADPSFDPVGNVRGNAGRNLCPAKEGAVPYLRTVWAGMLSQYRDIGLDYLTTWPYDEGGCGCESCRPWGANGYLDLVKLLYADAKAFYPEIKVILSAWTYDRPDDQGEYAGMYARLRGDLDFVSYVMSDAHADFPRYPLEHERVKPVINFPEISMWMLYPWGGYGANPLPARFHQIWNSAKTILDGGIPYSEGMYEDLSKIQFACYYWDPDRSMEDILSEYIGYEISDRVTEDVIRMIALIEKNHTLVADHCPPDKEGAIECGTLARSIDARLSDREKRAWRWRILYIRAILDEKRYAFYHAHMDGADDLDDIRRFGADFICDDPEAHALLSELQELYHSSPCDGRNQFTLPFKDGGTLHGSGKTYAQMCAIRGIPMRIPKR